jgi:transposase
MQWHLDEIACQVTRGAHGVLLLDQAGWHTTLKLKIPANLTLLLLPPRSPELNPAENIWQFMRDNWLSNRVLPLLRSLEQAHRSAVENHVHRTKGMGSWVLINADWYKGLFRP